MMKITTPITIIAKGARSINFVITDLSGISILSLLEDVGSIKKQANETVEKLVF
jgi:hypothetical protein